MRPDFAIIGAMKCGTTTLAAQLGAQDGVFMSTPKEPNFFSDDDVFARGMDWYEALFADAAPGDLKGEASTHYAKLPTHPDACDRLHAALPDLRLIYITRDPVARLVSHYIHEWSMGVISTDIETALETHPELIAYSRYGMQIEPYVARFGAGRIHWTTQEALRAAPEATLARAGAFLGLGATAWADDLAEMNVSAERIRKFPGYDLLINSPVATALRRALAPKALREAVKARLRKNERPELTPATRARLEAIFAEDAARFADLLPGRTP